MQLPHDHRALGVEHVDRLIDEAELDQRDIDGALLAENMDPGKVRMVPIQKGTISRSRSSHLCRKRVMAME